jgi:tetratricopeptide (TPR) repeat protein
VYEGEFDLARANFKRALPVSQKMDLHTDALKAYENLGMVFISAWNYLSASENLLEAVEICRQIGDLRSEAIALGNLGTIYRYTWRPEKALQNFQQAFLIDTPGE